MFKLISNRRLATPTRQVLNVAGNSQRRSFWEYVNMMFNNPDQERIRKFGPDRACAEWVLRNGGAVVWTNHHKQTDYNQLPSEEQGVPQILEIDGTNSSISHYGFSHIIGCTGLKKVVLHNCKYIDDRAMKGLGHGKDTLNHLQVSSCANVTDVGVKDLHVLSKLDALVLFDLASVQNMDKCKQYLKAQLPKCNIKGE